MGLWMIGVLSQYCLPILKEKLFLVLMVHELIALSRIRDSGFYLMIMQRWLLR
jgi:hypothetical protein